MEQQPVNRANNQHNYELVEQGDAVPYGRMGLRADDNGEPYEMMEPGQHQIQRPPAHRVFNPTAFIPPVYVPPQPRANNVQEVDVANGIQNQEEEEEEEEEEDDETNMARFDANEHTVWIDSDGDEETENIILKQNFFLPYSDHNYDPPDPSERVNHPEEGPFPIIRGLSEDGRIIRQYMPPGYEDQGEEIGEPDEEELAERAAAAAAAAVEAQLVQMQHQQQPHVVHQQYQPQWQYWPPSLMPQQFARQPVNAVPPGNHMEYEPVRIAMPQRGFNSMIEQPYRMQHEYGTPMMAAQPRDFAMPPLPYLYQHYLDETPGVSGELLPSSSWPGPSSSTPSTSSSMHQHYLRLGQTQQLNSPHLRNLNPDPEPRINWPEGRLQLNNRPRKRAHEEEPVASYRSGARTLSSHQPSTPPGHPLPPGQQNLESDSEGIEGGKEENIVRCHCSMDHGGRTVQCPGCRKWQHMGCMGMVSIKTGYKCELCIPRKLPIEKAEARKIQKILLGKEKKEAEEAERKGEEAKGDTEKKAGKKRKAEQNEYREDKSQKRGRHGC